MTLTMAEANNAGAQPQATDPAAVPEPTFPPIGEEHPGDGAEGDEGQSVEERLAAMEAQREEDRKQFAEERKQWQTTVDRLLQGQAPAAQPPAQPQQSPQPQQSQVPELDLNGLPDPVDKPQEYHAELQRRMSTAMQRQAHTLQQTWQQQHQQFGQQVSQEQQLNQLWDKFRSQYSDLAEKEATLNGAVTAEVNGLRARGVDPMRGIFADPDGFMRNVADRMRKELGIGGQPAGGTTPPPTLNQDPPNRTQGLGGGTQQGGSKGKGGGNHPGFVSQLKKAQLDSGLI